MNPILIRLFPPPLDSHYFHQGYWWPPYCQIQWPILSPHLLIYQQHWLEAMSILLETLCSFDFQNALISCSLSLDATSRTSAGPSPPSQFQTLKHLKAQSSVLSPFYTYAPCDLVQPQNFKHKLQAGDSQILSQVQTLPLNSGIIFPNAYSIPPLAFVIGISNLTCPKLSSWIFFFLFYHKLEFSHLFNWCLCVSSTWSKNITYSSHTSPPIHQ